MTFVDAFDMSVTTGRPIRRASWSATATIKADLTERLVRTPERPHWSGDFSPSLDDVKADDWQFA
jgi:hypothetical protein